MSALSHNQTERLDFRTTPDTKSLIERAASIQGQTVSSFAIAVLSKAADEIIQRQSSRTLSNRDSQRFLTMLSASAEPNAALQDAATRYKERRGR